MNGTTQTGQATSSSLTLDPPDFKLPHEYSDGSDRYELWTLRLPIDLDLRKLSDVAIPIGKTGEVGDRCVEFEQDGITYALKLGDAVENENFRLLVSAPKEENDSDDDDSSDDDDDDKKKLQPTKRGFDKHWNIVQSIPEMTERQLAPRLDQAPAIAEPSEVRKAYSHVPQRSGLKRRWMPLGAQAAKRRVKQEESPPSTPAHEQRIKQEKSAVKPITPKSKPATPNASEAAKSPSKSDRKKKKRQRKSGRK